MTGYPRPPIFTAPFAPTSGPVAQSHALGAGEAVTFAVFWNAPLLPQLDISDEFVPLDDDPPRRLDTTGLIGPHGDEAALLRRMFGVVGTRSWRDTLDDHLRGQNINSTASELALDIREDVLDDAPGTGLDATDWVAAIRATGKREKWPTQRIRMVAEAAIRATHVERRLHDADFLTTGERVWTLVAEDLSRAVYLVHAGTRLGYATPDTAADALDAARENAAGVFTSWREYAASWLSAQLAMYGESIGRDYSDEQAEQIWQVAATVARTLLDDPLSPWATLPFPVPGPAE